MAGRYNNPYSGYMNPGLAEGFSNLSRAIFGSATDDNVAAAAASNRELARKRGIEADNAADARAAYEAVQPFIGDVLINGLPTLPQYAEVPSQEGAMLAAENPQLEGLAAPDRVVTAPTGGGYDMEKVSALARAMMLNPAETQNMWRSFGGARGFDAAQNNPDDMARWLPIMGGGGMPNQNFAPTPERADAIRNQTIQGQIQRDAAKPAARNSKTNPMGDKVFNAVVTGIQGIVDEFGFKNNEKGAQAQLEAAALEITKQTENPPAALLAIRQALRDGAPVFGVTSEEVDNNFFNFFAPNDHTKLKTGAQGSKPPVPGEIQKLPSGIYRFRGGSPNDPRSWEKL